MIVKATEFKIIHGDMQSISRNPHFVSVRMKRNSTERAIRKTFRDIFAKARNGKKTKIIFSILGLKDGLSTSPSDFPTIGVAKIVSQEILRFCRASPGALKEIVLTIENKENFLLFEKQVYGYLRHVQQDLGCGPYCTVDMIIEYRGGIVVIERTNPPFGFALPGGFVDNGETLEHAAIRETKEETNLALENLKQFHTYSDPCRDPRFQTISTVFTAKGKGVLRSGDDAKAAHLIPFTEILRYNFAFDHKKIITDYLQA